MPGLTFGHTDQRQDPKTKNEDKTWKDFSDGDGVLRRRGGSGAGAGAEDRGAGVRVAGARARAELAGLRVRCAGRAARGVEVAREGNRGRADRGDGGGCV